MRNPIKILIIIFCVINPILILGQTQEEIKSDVPELSSFHEVIFKLWHDAWQNENLPLFRELVPSIDSHLVKIQNAKLPGILRDKKTKWDQGLQELQTIITEYKKATATSDTQRILNAAEKLHSQYEKLVRIIKPLLKEIEAFHQVLYQLYHYYMPEYNKDKIKASSSEIQIKMEELNKVGLPERLISKRKLFLNKRIELDKSVKYFIKVVNEIDDEETITKAIKDMHAKYQALENVFD